MVQLTNINFYKNYSEKLYKLTLAYNSAIAEIESTQIIVDGKLDKEALNRVSSLREKAAFLSGKIRKITQGLESEDDVHESYIDLCLS